MLKQKQPRPCTWDEAEYSVIPPKLTHTGYTRPLDIFNADDTSLFSQCELRSATAAQTGAFTHRSLSLVLTNADNSVTAFTYTFIIYDIFAIVKPFNGFFIADILLILIYHPYFRKSYQNITGTDSVSLIYCPFL